VERDRSRLEAAEHRLHVLGAVVHVERDVILAGLPAGELGALALQTEPVRAEHAREAVGTRVDLSIKEAPLALHEALALGRRRCNSAKQFRQPELGHRPPAIAQQDRPRNYRRAANTARRRFTFAHAVAMPISASDPMSPT